MGTTGPWVIHSDNYLNKSWCIVGQSAFAWRLIRQNARRAPHLKPSTSSIPTTILSFGPAMSPSPLSATSVPLEKSPRRSSVDSYLVPEAGVGVLAARKGLRWFLDDLYSPFPNFTFSGSLRPAYPLSAKRHVSDNITCPDYAEDSQPLSTLSATDRYESYHVPGVPCGKRKASGQPPKILLTLLSLYM